MLKRVLEILCFFGGVAAISTGLWWIKPWAGLMFSGFAAVWLAYKSATLRSWTE